MLFTYINLTVTFVDAVRQANTLL